MPIMLLLLDWIDSIISLPDSNMGPKFEPYNIII